MSAVVIPWRGPRQGGGKALKALKALKVLKAGGMIAFSDRAGPRPCPTVARTA